MSATDVEHAGVRQSPGRSPGQRRRNAVVRFVRTFATHRTGMVGVGILLFFIVVALTAPLIFPEYLLDPNANLSNDDMAPPSTEFYYWLGTDDLGRSVLAELAWGARPSLIIGILASLIAMVIGTLVGIASGHFRGLFGGSHGAAHRLVPRPAVRAAGHRAAGGARTDQRSGSRWSSSASRPGRGRHDWCGPRR